MTAPADLMILDQVFTHESSTQVNHIHWTSFGSETAPSVIFVHGTPWSSRVWVPLAKALSRRFKVFLFDNPGYGETEARILINTENGERYLSVSLATQAEAFAALYHQCWKFGGNGEHPHVVAHDYGGIITLRAHLLHSCQYASLCLVDALAIRPLGSPYFRLVAKHPAIFESVLPPVFEGMLRAYMGGARYKPLPPGIEDMLVSPWLENGKQGQAGFVRQIAQTTEKHIEEVEGDYGNVGKNVPVKIVWGVEDEWIPVDRADRLSEMLGAKELVKIPKAGHLIMYDQPEVLAVEISQWLASNRGRD